MTIASTVSCRRACRGRGSGDIVAATLSAHGTEVSHFDDSSKVCGPRGLRRVPGQADGDEFDVDAAVRMCAERARGSGPVDRIYVRRERKERMSRPRFWST